MSPTSIFCKLIERFVRNNLVTNPIRNNFLSSAQYGFLPSRSAFDYSVFSTFRQNILDFVLVLSLSNRLIKLIIVSSWPKRKRLQYPLGCVNMALSECWSRWWTLTLMASVQRSSLRFCSRASAHLNIHHRSPSLRVAIFLDDGKLMCSSNEVDILLEELRVILLNFCPRYAI